MHKKIIFFGLLVMLPLLVYFSALKSELIWDDKPMITENDLLKGDFSLSAAFRSGYWASTSQRSSDYDYYRPLMVFSFMVEKAVWGLDPFRLHLVNLFIFIAGLFVLYFFLRRQTVLDGIAETTVLLFALFPLNLDSIAWVVGRNDLMILCFGLLALYFFDLFLEQRSVLLGALSVVSYLLALFSKEAALFFLPVFLLHDLVRRKRPCYPIHAVYLIASALYWTVKSAVISQGTLPLIRFFSPFWENVRVLLGVLGYYFRSLLFPFRYDMFLPVNTVTNALHVILGLLFLLLLAWLLWLGRKKIQYVQAWIWSAPYLAGYLLFVFTPMYPFNISTRYLMLPTIGLAWLVSHFLRSLPRFFGRLVLVALLMASVSTIIGNIPRYRNESSFWGSAVKSCPDNSFFLSKYAGQLREDGDFVRSEMLLRRALNFSMDNSTAVAIALQMADIAINQARYARALDWLDKMGSLALDLSQTNYRLVKFLRIHWARGELAKAEEAMGAILFLVPNEANKKMRLKLYLAFAAWEKAREAARAFSGTEAGNWLVLVEKAKLAFEAMPPQRQSLYFLDHENFNFAWKSRPREIRSDFASRLQEARLAFLSEHDEEGNSLIAAMAETGADDFRIQNSLGNLFFDLQRADRALPFYQRSLQLNPGQSALRERMKRLDWKNISPLLE
ncbi:MAG: hypothetical protein JXI33_06005 [Candidatus Aminicenantes bacterium]|nr:hypothetical protein [Candidatus Aminicenantes bacterium]